MRRVDLPAGHEVVNSDELRTLRKKARSHDAYLWATRRMADHVRNLEAGAAGFTPIEGYRHALYDFARFVVEAPTVE